MTALTKEENEVIAKLEEAGVINNIRQAMGLDVNDDNIPDERWIGTDGRIANMSAIDLIDAYFQWEGFIGWGGTIYRVVNAIQDIKKNGG